MKPWEYMDEDKYRPWAAEQFDKFVNGVNKAGTEWVDEAKRVWNVFKQPVEQQTADINNPPPLPEWMRPEYWNEPTAAKVGEAALGTAGAVFGGEGNLIRGIVADQRAKGNDSPLLGAADTVGTGLQQTLGYGIGAISGLGNVLGQEVSRDDALLTGGLRGWAPAPDNDPNMLPGYNTFLQNASPEERIVVPLAGQMLDPTFAALNAAKEGKAIKASELMSKGQLGLLGGSVAAEAIPQQPGESDAAYNVRKGLGVAAAGAAMLGVGHEKPLSGAEKPVEAVSAPETINPAPVENAAPVDAYTKAAEYGDVPEKALAARDANQQNVIYNIQQRVLPLKEAGVGKGEAYANLIKDAGYVNADDFNAAWDSPPVEKPVSKRAAINLDDLRKGTTAYSAVAPAAALIPQQPGESDDVYKARVALGIAGTGLGAFAMVKHGRTIKLDAVPASARQVVSNLYEQGQRKVYMYDGQVVLRDRDGYHVATPDGVKTLDNIDESKLALIDDTPDEGVSLGQLSNMFRENSPYLARISDEAATGNPVYVHPGRKLALTNRGDGWVALSPKGGDIPIGKEIDTSTLLKVSPPEAVKPPEAPPEIAPTPDGEVIGKTIKMNATDPLLSRDQLISMIKRIEADPSITHIIDPEVSEPTPRDIVLEDLRAQLADLAPDAAKITPDSSPAELKLALHRSLVADGVDDTTATHLSEEAVKGKLDPEMEKLIAETIDGKESKALYDQLRAKVAEVESAPPDTTTTPPPVETPAPRKETPGAAALRLAVEGESPRARFARENATTEIKPGPKANETSARYDAWQSKPTHLPEYFRQSVEEIRKDVLTRRKLPREEVGSLTPTQARKILDAKDHVEGNGGRVPLEFGSVWDTKNNRFGYDKTVAARQRLEAQLDFEGHKREIPSVRPYDTAVDAQTTRLSGVTYSNNYVFPSISPTALKGGDVLTQWEKRLAELEAIPKADWTTRKVKFGDQHETYTVPSAISVARVRIAALRKKAGLAAEEGPVARSEEANRVNTATASNLSDVEKSAVAEKIARASSDAEARQIAQDVIARFSDKGLDELPSSLLTESKREPRPVLTEIHAPNTLEETPHWLAGADDLPPEKISELDGFLSYARDRLVPGQGDDAQFESFVTRAWDTWKAEGNKPEDFASFISENVIDAADEFGTNTLAQGETVALPRLAGNLQGLDAAMAYLERLFSLQELRAQGVKSISYGGISPANIETEIKRFRRYVNDKFTQYRGANGGSVEDLNLPMSPVDATMSPIEMYTAYNIRQHTLEGLKSDYVRFNDGTLAHRDYAISVIDDQKSKLLDGLKAAPAAVQPPPPASPSKTSPASPSQTPPPPLKSSAGQPPLAKTPPPPPVPSSTSSGVVRPQTPRADWELPVSQSAHYHYTNIENHAVSMAVPHVPQAVTEVARGALSHIDPIAFADVDPLHPHKITPLVFSALEGELDDVYRNAMIRAHDRWQNRWDGKISQEGWFDTSIVDYKTPRPDGRGPAWGDVFEHPEQFNIKDATLEPYIKYLWKLVDEEKTKNKIAGAPIPDGDYGIGHWFGRFVKEFVGMAENVQKEGRWEHSLPRAYDSMEAGIERNVRYVNNPVAVFGAMISYIHRRRAGHEMFDLLKEWGRTPKQLVSQSLKKQALLTGKNRGYVKQALGMTDYMTKRGYLPKHPVANGPNMAWDYPLKRVEQMMQDRAQAYRMILGNMNPTDPKYQQVTDMVNAFSRPFLPDLMTIDQMAQGDAVVARQLYNQHDISDRLKLLLKDVTSEATDAQRNYNDALRRLETAMRAPGQSWMNTPYGVPTGDIAVGKINASWAGNLLFPAQVSDHMNKWLNVNVKDEYKGLAAVRNASAWLRYFQTSADLGTGFTQLLPGAAGHPKQWGQAMSGMFRAVIDPRFNDGYMNVKANQEVWQILGPHGLTLEAPDTVDAFHETPGLMTKLNGSRPVRALTSRSNAVFTQPLIIFKTEVAKAMLPEIMQKYQGARRIEEYKALASYLNAMTGTMSAKRLGIGRTQRTLESALLFFSARYTRSAFALMSMAIRPGNTKAQWAARRTLGMLPVMSLIVPAAMNAVLTGKPPDEGYFDPTNSKFGTVQLFGRNIGFGSIYRSMLTTTAKIYQDVRDGNADNLVSKNRLDNPLIGWYASRTAPVTSLLWDVLDQKDFIGEPLNWPDRAMKQFTPMWFPEAAQQVASGDVGNAIAGTATDVLGMRSIPLSTAQKRNNLREQYAKANGVDSWNQLGRYDQKLITTENPELKALTDQTSDEMANRGDEVSLFWKDVDARRAPILAQMQDLKDKLDNGVISGEQYRKEQSYLERQYGTMPTSMKQEARWSKIPLTAAERVSYYGANNKPTASSALDDFIEAWYNASQQATDPTNDQIDPAKLGDIRDKLVASTPKDVVDKGMLFINKSRPEDYKRALAVYQEYAKIPKYYGIGLDVQAKIDQASLLVQEEGKRLPPGMANASTYARYLAAQERPDLLKYINVLPYLSKLRSPARRIFWAQNADVLQKYFGAVPLGEEDVLSQTASDGGNTGA